MYDSSFEKVRGRSGLADTTLYENLSSIQKKKSIADIYSSQ